MVPNGSSQAGGVTLPGAHRRPGAAGRSGLRLIAAGLAIGAAAVPFWQMFRIISSTGADNLSNDYILYIDMMDRILSGSYAWGSLARDTFLSGHFLLLPFLFHVGAAYLADWNVYIEMYAGLLMAVVRLALLYDALSRSGFARRPVWLLPMLSALVFSLSQISGFAFGDATLPLELTLLGFTLGWWGLVRFRGRWRAIGLMCLGGLIANWSWGAGLGAWPAYLLGLALLDYRRLGHYAGWLAGALIAYAFHFYFILISPTLMTSGRAVVLSWFNRQQIVNTLGRPFASGIGTNYQHLPQAELSAAVGLGLCLAGLGLLLAWRDRAAVRRAAPALMLMVYSLIGAWQTTLFRRDVAPWYATVVISFWIGLVALAYALWAQAGLRSGGAGHRPVVGWLSRGFGLVSLGSLAFLYVTTNLTYEDKDFYLPSRSPAAAACLRHFRTGPTYCEQYVFQWGVGRGDILARLAEPLERHRLSVFAPRQRWTMQGAVALGAVDLQEPPDGSAVIWSKDLSSAAVPWSSYQRLNLLLPAPAEARWTVTLPADLRRASFHSALAAVPSAASPPAPLDVAIHIDAESGALAALRQTLPADARHWQGVDIPLDQYAGQTITLRLTVTRAGEPSDARAAFQYPYLDLYVGERAAANRTIQPVNTDLSPAAQLPTPADLLFDLTDPAEWDFGGLEAPAAGAALAWNVGRDSALHYRPRLDECLRDYRYFYARLAAAADILPRAFEAELGVDDQALGPRRVSFRVPLLTGEAMHAYTYDLRLLELPRRSRLTSLVFRPSVYGAGPGEHWVRLEDVRLIRDFDSIGCGPR